MFILTSSKPHILFLPTSFHICKNPFGQARKSNVILLLLLFFYNFSKAQKSQWVHWYEALQKSRSDRLYEDILKEKTYCMVPIKKDTIIKKVLILNPLVEYRYYNNTRVIHSIYDSSFASKTAFTVSNYTLLPNKNKQTQLLFGLEMYRVLSKYSDTILTSFNDSVSHIIKEDINKLTQKARIVGINKKDINASLFALFKNLNYDHLVLTNILVFEIPRTTPGIYIKFTFCVLDLQNKEIFFYENSFAALQYFRIDNFPFLHRPYPLDSSDDRNLRKALPLFLAGQMSKEYAKFIRKPQKKKRNKKYKFDNDQ